jgi:TolA-binding protein
MADQPPVKPWRETDEHDRAAELVRLVAGIPPRAVDVGKGWDSVIERVARPRSSRALWFAAAAAAVLLAWVSVQWPFGGSRPAPVPVPAVANVAPPECEGPLMCVEGARPPAPVVEAPVAPKKVPRAVAAREPEEESLPSPSPAPVVDAPAEGVAVASGAVWSSPSPAALKLDLGRVEVRPHAEPYTVTTPEVTLSSTNARYAADVTEAGTTVRVFEGDVEVFNGRERVTLSAGEERTFRAGPAPSALDVVPPAVSSPACARYSLEQRVACLSKEGGGVGLRAQAALYEAAYLQAKAGRAAGAELTLRESLRRFPHGVLHPEVRMALIKALVAQGRLGEAGDVGRDFLFECEGDPRVSEVEAFLRTLDWLESR